MRVIFLSSFIFTSCNKASNESEISNLKKENDSLKQVLNATKEKTEEKTAELDFLKTANGKYTWDIKLFENESFKKRLSKLIGSVNFTFLIGYWNLESPMSFSGNVFIAEGCKQHNCNMTNFIIVYDFTNNVMYVGMRKEGEVKTFSEDAGDSPKVIEWRGWK